VFQRQPGPVQPPVEGVQPRAPHGAGSSFLDGEPGAQGTDRSRERRWHLALRNELVTIKHASSVSELTPVDTDRCDAL
jgi:hypothetical protein